LHDVREQHGGQRARKAQPRPVHVETPRQLHGGLRGRSLIITTDVRLTVRVTCSREGWPKVLHTQAQRQ
jgi:hypothetical protein